MDTISQIRAQGGLVSMPHPCDPFRGSVIQADLLEELLPLVDIVEVFNARNTLNASDRRAAQLADRYNLLRSAVSDAHTPQELGRTYVEFPEFDGTPDGFKLSLQQAQLITRRTNPLIHVLTTYTKLKRRILGNLAG